MATSSFAMVIGKRAHLMDKMLELQAVMERETGRKWIKALVHIKRADESLDIKFEYDDPKKWVISPSNLDASVAALKA